MKISRPIPRRKIPENAKTVFKGKIYDVVQWEQEMYDGSFQTFEMLRRLDTVGVIPITNDGKIVLSKQGQPDREDFIGIFGGRMEVGETPEETARRELLEESGIKCSNLKLWFSEQPIASTDYASYFFIATDLEFTGKTDLDNGEKIETFEVTLPEFIEITRSGDFRDIQIALKIHRLDGKNDKLNELGKIFGIVNK